MTVNFCFSQRSEKNLQGVNSALVSVARRALELSPVDFGITEGFERWGGNVKWYGPEKAKR